MNVSPGKLAAAGGIVTALGIALIMAAARQQGIADAANYYEGRKKPCGCPEHDAEDVAAASAEMAGEPEPVAGLSEEAAAEPVAVDRRAGRPRDPKTGRLLPMSRAETNGAEPNGSGELPEREAGVKGLPPRPAPADRAVPAEPVPPGAGLPPRSRPDRPSNAPSMGAAT